jgi:myo-inositol-1(or 4)-monophosphatase
MNRLNKESLLGQEIELTDAREFLSKISEEAGETLGKYFISGNYSSRQKEGVDFTTQADEEVDSFLRESIKRKYPNTNFLTEETAPDDYTPLKNAENLWVIDPLDGTINFSRKHSNFAISIALVNKGKSKLAVVYLPVTKDLYWAQEDQEGTYLNGLPVGVSETDDLGKSVIGCDWAWGLEKRKNIIFWLSKICTHVRQIKSMGSAVSDLASLSSGKIDCYIHSGLKPWDVAASSFLVTKAGGRITTPNGEVWDVFNSDIFASNNLLHQKIIDLLNKA